MMLIGTVPESKISERVMLRESGVTEWNDPDLVHISSITAAGT